MSNRKHRPPMLDEDEKAAFEALRRADAAVIVQLRREAQEARREIAELRESNRRLLGERERLLYQVDLLSAGL